MKAFLNYIIVPLFVALLTTINVAAKSPLPELNLSSSGVALRGYDPVAYFKVGKPVKGNSKISVLNAGAKYYFSSSENRKLFLQNPTKYLPEYGGYCSYGTAVKTKVDGDPRVWHIVDGKLYLNITRSVDKTWLRNQKKYIRDANRNWPKLKN